MKIQLDLKRAQMIAESLIGYYTLNEYRFKFDNAKRRFGHCHIDRKEISVSAPLTILNSEERFINTVLHEIAHALVPFDGHTEKWRKKAISIGCDGERCYNTNEVIGVPKQYIGQCPGCYGEIKRHRRKTLSCSRCSGGSFNRDYVFKWRLRDV